MQGNVSAGRPNPAPRQFSSNDGGMTHSNMSRGSRWPWILLVVVLLAAVLALGMLFRDKLGMEKAEGVSEYQAVFLTNGQVYFGKLEDVHDRYVTLTDIYYLQVNQQLQQGQQETGQQPQLSLVKLGNELHGPLDEMQINRDHILFFEDIKEDGRVAQAIAEYKANPEAANQQQQTPQTQTPQTNTPSNSSQNQNR